MTPPSILVFGSAKERLGHAICLEASRRGYQVGIHYNTSQKDALLTEKACLKHGASNTIVVKGDVSNEQDVAGIIAKVAKKFGSLDLVVTAAAIWKEKKLLDTDADLVREHFEINTLGTFLCCKHAGKIMTRQKSGGLIVTMGDWATVRPYIDYAAYFASKGGIQTLTATFANELANLNPNVRVNCILPGPVMVPESVSKAEKKKIAGKTLLKRLGTPEHIVKTVFFLADNDFVTGVAIPVDGGRSVFGLER